MASHNRELEILLVGKTGNGKSATGNSITLKKSFKSRNKMGAVTTTAQVEYSEFEGRKLKVVDTPGLGDTNMGEKETFDHFKQAKESMTTNPDGYVVLIIVKYGNRFGEENVQAVQQLNQIFGKDFIERHAILVFTCGDKFEEEDFVIETNVTFEDWVKEQSVNTAFKALIQECGHRVLLFDNRTKENAKQLKQLRQLIETIDNLCVDNKLDTKEQLNKTDEASENMVDDIRGSQLREEVTEKTSLVTERLSQLNGGISRSNPEHVLDELQKMRKDTADLYQTVVEHHKVKGGLSVETETLSRLQDDIRKQIQLFSQRKLDLQKEAKEKELKKLKLEKEEHEAKKKQNQELELKRKEKEPELKRKEKERLSQIEVQKRDNAERQKRLAENEDLKSQTDKHRWTEDELIRAEEEKRKIEEGQLKYLEEDRKILEKERKQLEDEKEVIALKAQLTAQKAAEIQLMKEKEESRRREEEQLEEAEKLLRQKREELRQKEERFRIEEKERREAEIREQEAYEALKRQREEEEWRRREEDRRRKEEEIRIETERQRKRILGRICVLVVGFGMIFLVASIALRKNAEDAVEESLPKI